MSAAPFPYDLLESKIAFHPPKQRGASRLLVLDKSTGQLQDKYYADLPDLLQPSDLVIINDTRVIKARLQAKTVSGQMRELFLSEKHTAPLLSLTARVIYRGKLRVGDVLLVGPESMEVRELLGNGQAVIRATIPPRILAERYGEVPLPPYIRRAVETDDVERYQTIFARTDGSVAAPTASLNLTEEIMSALVERGISIAPLTLHIGRGTFLPIRDGDVANHQMHSEYYSISGKTVQAIRQVKAAGRRVVAIGTTVTRALEHAAETLFEAPKKPFAITHHSQLDDFGRNRGEADIFITPGYEFRVVDALVTNFHAPDSTVLQLAAAFAGVDHLAAAYQHALAGPYRFLSYGDSMLIQ